MSRPKLSVVCVRLGILSRDRVGRLDPLVTEQSKQRPRRLYHHVFARAGELRDANGVLRVGNGEPLSDRPPRSMAPRRLVESDDPFVRTSRVLSPRSHGIYLLIDSGVVSGQVRRMFSVLSATQKRWMATGWCAPRNP